MNKVVKVRFGCHSYVCLIFLVFLNIKGVYSLICYCTGNHCSPNDEACDGTPNGSPCCETMFGSCFVQAVSQLNVTYGCVYFILAESCNRPGALESLSCCDNSSYCNRQLPAPPWPSVKPVPVVRNFSDFSSNILSMETVLLNESSSSNESPPPVSIIAPISIVMVVGVAILLCLTVAATVFLVRRKKMKHLRRRSISDKKGLEGGRFDETIPNYMQIVDATRLTMSEMTLTCTSGSGGGLPQLVERTIAKGTSITDMIGGGRFGQVYLGYYQGEKYAVKKFFSRDEQSWFREKQIYNSFNMRHDNILMYFAADILSNNGVTELWLITQFHPRGSLFDELHRDSLSVEQTMKYVFSTCRGIAYLHMEFPGAQGKPSIAHRDLKSKNLLVKNDDTLCIADFGLAVVQNNPLLSKPESLRQGTKRYMAPELLEEKVNPKNFESFLRTDMYSFGIVLWEICRRSSSGGDPDHYELPFQYIVPHDPSFEDMREAVVLKGITPDMPDRWNQDELLNGLSQLMLECWQKNPAARPTSCHIKKKLAKLFDSCDMKVMYNLQ